MIAGSALAATPLLDSSALRGDPDGIRRRAARDGCLRMRGLVDPGAIAALRALVIARCAHLGWLAPGATDAEPLANPAVHGVRTGDPAGLDLQVAVLASPELERVRRDPGLSGVLHALLGDGFAVAQGDVCRVVFPAADELTTPPHQDGAYVGATRECWTVWIPLADCPLERGPLALLPGSHRGGLLAHAGESGAVAAPEQGWAASPLATGDALFFSALTLHAALPNRSAGLLRLSVDLRYRAAG